MTQHPKLHEAWKKRTELCAEADKLRAEGTHLYSRADNRRAEGNKLRTEVSEVSKFYAEAYKRLAEAEKLHAEADKLRAEADTLRAESRRIHAESNILWYAAIIEVHGDIELKWSSRTDKPCYGVCTLPNGEVYGLDPVPA